MRHYNRIAWAGAFCITFVSGALWYALNTEIIVFSIPAYAEYTLHPAKKKELTLFWYTEKEKIEETTECIWSDSMQQNLSTLVSTWLCYMQEEDLLDRRIKLETVAVNAAGHDAYISCSHRFLEEKNNILKKWYVVESLRATLKKAFPGLLTVSFFVRGQPLIDEHIDFGTQIPLIDFLNAQHTALPAPFTPKKHYTFMIHPAGDKQRTGRVIFREFERKLTRQVAHELKKILEDTGRCKVMITHEIGHHVEQEESATCANRIGADAYLHINFFESTKIVPEIICYFPLYNPSTDFWHKKRDALTLQPIDKAYLTHIDESLRLGTTMTKNIAMLSNNRFIIHKAYGLPLTALIGIQTSSCVIECGIQKVEQVDELICVIADSIKQTFLYDEV